MPETPLPIFLVDDTPSDRELTLHELHRHGVTNEIVAVDSGVLALDYLCGARGAHAAGVDASRALPLVVLLDLRLPLIDGVEVLRRIRADARTKSLPVIVLTGSDTMLDSTRCYSLGASHVLVKPLVFAAFRSALERLGLDAGLLRADASARHA